MNLEIDRISISNSDMVLNHTTHSEIQIGPDDDLRVAPDHCCGLAHTKNTLVS
jgi:hypothetical protein